MAGARQTRSQLVLPDIDPHILGRSPLRAARDALKHTPTAVPPMSEVFAPAVQETAPEHDVPAKRPSSPLKDTVALRERELKRAKHGESDGENQSTNPATFSFFPSKKPTSSSSAPSVSADYTPARLRRSQSAPMETATPIPHLDLHRVPPSPWRTPGIKLRITTVSSMDTIADEPSVLLQQASEDIVMATPTAGGSIHPIPSAAAMVEMTEPPQTNATASSDIPPTSSPLPSLPTSPVDELPPIIGTPPLLLTPRKTNSDLGTHSSPLTPISATSWISKPAAGLEKEDAAPGKLSEGSVHSVLRPKTPVASIGSRLPRPSPAPSAVAPLVSPLTTKPIPKPKVASRVRSMKPRQPSRPIPLGGRMTRSASLRQQVSKKADIIVAEPIVKLNIHPNANPPSAGSGTASSSTVVSTAAKTSGRRRSMSFSYAMPTSSSAAKSNPGSPTKPHSTIATSSNIHSFTFSRASQPPPSSLSNLSQALKKLNLPPPSRPNTSMGFNRDIRGGDTDDEGDTPARSTHSQDDGEVSMRSSGSEGAAKRAAPLKRSATIGHVGSRPGSSTKPPPLAHSKLMLPPPVPKAKVTSTSSSDEAPKRINLQSDIVAGKPKGNFTFGNKALPTSKPRIFGVGAMAGLGAKGRVVHRASKQSSLPVVEGSPVKGGESSMAGGDMGVEKPLPAMSIALNDEAKEVTNNMDMRIAEFSSYDAAAVEASATVNGNGKEVETNAADSWETHASRRASMASQLLSQSLSSLPQTPPRPVAPATEGKGKGRVGLRSASSSYPPSAQGMHTAPGALGKVAVSGTSDGAHVSKTKAGSASGATGSLKVLKDCTIFVDVRTDDGDDAGGLFVDMLRGMGAKMLTRVGQTCTHIVYKNGLMSTLTRYRLLHEPRPLVVGIAWVVECVEQRSKVEEKKFLIDLEGVNVAGSNKRRRSMLPKSLSNIHMEPRELPSPSGSADGNGSMESYTSSAIMINDDSPKGADDNMTPLERARRRNNTIKSMFSRAS